MKMKTYIAGPIDANNYLLWDEKSKDAILIDCSDFKEEILDDIKTNGLNLKYILLTHGHFDHVLGVNKTAEVLGAKVGIHQSDVVLLENINEFARLVGFPPITPPKHDFTVSDNETLEFGNLKIKILHTPGHTEGGVCYLIENNLFSGDTLFKDYYGRTDLFGGDFDKIKSSIKNIIFKLDDNIQVFPGHDQKTSIGYEKIHNEINR